MKRIAFLISNGGTGSNLQAVIDATTSGNVKGKVVVVVSDTLDAYGLKRAEKHKIPTYIFKKGESLEKILLEQYKVDFVALGGWKQIIPDSFIDAFPNRIFNIHPGLIPDTLDGVVKNPDGTDGLWNKGKFTEKAINNFLKSKATYAGSTVHFLSKEFDFGPVLERCFERILPNDTVESLYERLKKKEHQIYVKAFARMCE